ncbi:MAG: chemoreceptor glutamine deamidase CheD [Aeromonas sp.]
MAREVILQPGEIFFGNEDVVVKTLLGSCIAITLWHPEQKQGGMCHYMLPSRGHPSTGLDGRYADEALTLLLQAASRYPATIHEYEVKLFGGGNMFTEQQYTRNDNSVATRNIEAAWQLTRQLGLDIKAHHLGRSGHRRVLFELSNGSVWLRHHYLPNQRGQQ